MRQTLLAAMAVLAAATVSVPSSLEAQSGRWNADYLPNLPVVTQDGKTLKFYDDVIKDKIVVISFIYTSCQDICPLTTARMAQLADKLQSSRAFACLGHSASPMQRSHHPDEQRSHLGIVVDDHDGPDWARQPAENLGELVATDRFR